ncbi:hypothetical protein QJS04_geneDACA014178 [Acorus gramineus]|uniref:Uncharacterized protein n=1 Tax=Acorus gramineus TaxID=55184 RepID=A0AAV9B162_ACOGR|nr:hypothetical protein QJS04_geneDACA014178 [Acorus gramineus]
MNNNGCKENVIQPRNRTISEKKIRRTKAQIGCECSKRRNCLRTSTCSGSGTECVCGGSLLVDLDRRFRYRMVENDS